MSTKAYQSVLMAGILLSVYAWGADAPAPAEKTPERTVADADAWFLRHPETLWAPLAEKWGAMQAAMTAPVENLMLPLDYYENGRMKAVLRAKKSQLFLDGLIFAEGVSIDLLTEDGKPDGRLTAEGCLFDRAVKRGYCEGAVSMVKGADRLKGRGMCFSIEERYIKILSECEIRTRRIPVKLGRLS